MSFYLTDSEVIIHSDHKPLQKFTDAITANSIVNDWSFQIHAICKSITFVHIRGTSNVLADSLSRLKYYDLYDEPKPEKPGYEFNKPKRKYDEVVTQALGPPQSAYEAESKWSVFSLVLDPLAPVNDKTSELQMHVTDKISVEKLREAQRKEYLHRIKALEKHGKNLEHLYVLDKDGLLH